MFPFQMSFLTLPYPQFDPVALHLGSISVRWYGLAYAAGLLIGWLYLRRMIATPRIWGGPPPLSREHLDSLLLWVTAGVVIGGRLIGILLYDPMDYIKNPFEIIAVWHGGMAFHGGLLGVILAILLFSRTHLLTALQVGDLVAASVPIGLFFGRVANFINGELWGRTSNVPWAMVFPDPSAGPLPRHPSQLYEAVLEGIVLGIVLWWLIWRQGRLQQQGFVTGAFLVGYGLARVTAEAFREGDSTWFFQSGVVTAGMLYSVPMVLIGTLLIWWATHRYTAVMPS